MKRIVAVASLLTVVASTSQSNLLTNHSFEVAGTAEERARCWEDDVQGGIWGSTIRSDWQSYRGKYSFALRGAWSGADHAGFWQACPITSNTRYVLSAAFMWDNAWAADECEIRVEWYAGDHRLSEDRKDIVRLPEAQWTPLALSAIAPTGADQAHIVMEVSGIKEEGVLYVDEIVFEKE